MDKFIQQEFKALIKNGWLTQKEAEVFESNQDIADCISSCTSPSKENIFRALKSLSISDVKVVILGKDPYPNPKDAHGLAFSSDNPSTPDSLKNIFKAIDKAFGSNLFHKSQNNLSNWVKEGTLLLNTGLTYSKVEDKSLDKKSLNLLQARVQNKHMKIWKPFVKLIIKKILSITDRPVVMMLWGNDAHNIVFSNIYDKEFKLKAHTRNCIIIPNTKIMLLQTSHPSPLSVNRGGDFPDTAPKHFLECDKHLGKDKINWINL